MKLIDYIEKHYNGNQAEFAKVQGVQRQQVTQWLNKPFIVIDGALYSKRRELKN